MGVLEREIRERDEPGPGFATMVDEELAPLRAFHDDVNAIIDELAGRRPTRAELARAAGNAAAHVRRLLTRACLSMWSLRWGLRGTTRWRP